MFRKLAHRTAELVGSPMVFFFALITVGIWALTGRYFGYSDTWQLVINTGTTIITFLVVFLVQNTQNRDAKAIHLKLDEVIRAIKGARNDLLDIEDEPDQRLKDLHQEFHDLSEKTKELEQIHKDELAKL